MRLDAAELHRFGEALGRTLAPPATIGFSGDLGAGKTTLIQAVCRGLGALALATSPTYALVNLYRGRVRVVHADWYRIASADELYAVGFADLYEDSAVIIEWMDRVPEAAPAERLEVLLEGSGSERRITLRPFGARYERMVEKLAAP